MQETIHIALCADEKFSLPMGVCITSVLENNKSHKLHLHILTSGFSNDTVKRIKSTSIEYNQKIEVHKIEDRIFDSYPLSGTFPKSIYYRYLLSGILDESIKKILYLDSDIIVLDSLLKIYSTNLNNFAIGAVPDANTDDIIERNRIGIYEGYYLNSGVLLINLEYWRENQVFHKLAKFIRENPEKCLWPDQDTLNVILHDKIKWMPFESNFQVVFAGDFNSYRMKRDLQYKVVESFPDIAVMHFSSWDKPWFKESKNPLSFVWRYYRNISKWNNITLKSRGYRYKFKQKLGIETKNNEIFVNPLFETAFDLLKQKYTNFSH